MPCITYLPSIFSSSLFLQRLRDAPKHTEYTEYKDESENSWQTPRIVFHNAEIYESNNPAMLQYRP